MNNRQADRMYRIMTSPIAIITYMTATLAGLKLLGAHLTWTMVFFPIWGVGVLLILLFTLVALIIGGLTP